MYRLGLDDLYLFPLSRCGIYVGAPECISSRYTMRMCSIIQGSIGEASPVPNYLVAVNIFRISVPL